MIQLALVVAAGSLASGLVLAYLLRRAPTVWAQLAGLALIAVCVPLAAVLLSGWVMFHMGADVKILAVAAGSATAAVFAALVLARSITASLRRVGAASQSLAAGELSARAPTGGAREIAELAESFNAMAAALEQLFDARRELVAWASHDLRAPIASLQAMLEAIEDGLVPAEDYLPTAREQVNMVGAGLSEIYIEDLTKALVETGATLAFDAIGGGKLASQILTCMEAAASKTAKVYSRYGSAVHKQVYIYGSLDPRPIELDRTFGMAWGVGGWLLFSFLQKIGAVEAQKLRERVVAELKTTFASHYTQVVSLQEALQLQNIAAYIKRATGEKYLINPNKAG